MTFTVGKTVYAVRADLGSWSDLPADPTFSAGATGRLDPVKGSVDLDNSTVTVSAPYSVLGAAGRKGATWTRFTVNAQEVVAEVPASPSPPGLHDSGSSTKTYRAGSAFAVPFGPPPPPPGARR